MSAPSGARAPPDQSARLSTDSQRSSPGPASLLRTAPGSFWHSSRQSKNMVSQEWQLAPVLLLVRPAPAKTAAYRVAMHECFGAREPDRQGGVTRLSTPKPSKGPASLPCHIATALWQRLTDYERPNIKSLILNETILCNTGGPRVTNRPLLPSPASGSGSAPQPPRPLCPGCPAWPAAPPGRRQARREPTAPSHWSRSAARG